MHRLLDPGVDPGPTDVHGLTAAMLAGQPRYAGVDAQLTLHAARPEPGRPQRRLRLRVPRTPKPTAAAPICPSREVLCTFELADLLDLDLDSLSLAAVAAGTGTSPRQTPYRPHRLQAAAQRPQGLYRSGLAEVDRFIQAWASLVPDASPPARNSAGSARSRRPRRQRRCSFPVFPPTRQPRPCQHMAHRDELKSPATTKVGSPAAGASVASSRAASASAPD